MVAVTQISADTLERNEITTVTPMFLSASESSLYMALYKFILPYLLTFYLTYLLTFRNPVTV